MPPKRPKPKAIADTAETRYAKWVDRQLTEALGEHSSLSAAIAANVTDTSAIEADIDALETAVDALETTSADHESRIDDLEADEASNKTVGYAGQYRNLGGGAGVTYYWQPYGFKDLNSPPTTIWEAQFLWPRAGTIKNLRFVNTNPIADTDQFTLTLNVNGVDTALTKSGLSANTSTIQSDTTHSVSVAVGDLVCFVQVTGAAGINPGSGPTWCFDFVEAA